MIDRARHIIDQLQWKWRLLRVTEVVVCGLIVSISVYFIGFQGLTLALLTSCILALFFVWTKPWSTNSNSVVTLINNQLPSVQYSTNQILIPEPDLTTLGRLQQHRAAIALVSDSNKIRLPFLWRRIISVSAFCLLGISLFKASDHFLLLENKNGSKDIEKVNIFPLDTNSLATTEPKVVELSITITPPLYTGEAKVMQSAAELEVIESSGIHWLVTTNTRVDSLFLVTSGTQRYLLKPLKNTVYEGFAKIKRNGFYNFLLVKNGKSYLTDLFPIEVVSDQPPKLEVKDIDERTEFDYWDKKEISFSCIVSDDFGLTDSYIIATVSKGSGESVKFREEKLFFDKAVPNGSRYAVLSRTIDLNAMSVSPGDELYFYIEAVDNREPSKQRSRTSTYFITVRDTTDVEFSIEGNLGVDVVPEYFRSQRQIIIDTEKLIASGTELTKSDFNFTSNELGFDQKSLRIRYGQFMGEEFETDMSGTVEESSTDDTNADDPLEEFSHNHDGENEHNLVEYFKHKHDHEHESEHDHEDDLESDPQTEEDPLEQYQHVHDDPEEATFFTVTIKEKLRQALTEMWDAELYLRLYQPEKSLPYQYRSLKLLKEIKNHARVYVHRMGFDPPPIKEDSRWTGNLEEVMNSSRVLKAEPAEVVFISEACSVLQRIVETGDPLSTVSRSSLKSAGDILGLWAIKEPGKYLETLGLLNKLIELNAQDPELAQLLLDKFLEIIEPDPKKVHEVAYPQDVLSKIFRNNLDRQRD